MLQVKEPTKMITVHFQCYDNTPPEADNYVAWIEGNEYRGILVTGDSILKCIEEIGISLKVLELYRKNTKDR